MLGLIGLNGILVFPVPKVWVRKVGVLPVVPALPVPVEVLPTVGVPAPGGGLVFPTCGGVVGGVWPSVMTWGSSSFLVGSSSLS